MSQSQILDVSLFNPDSGIKERKMLFTKFLWMPYKPLTWIYSQNNKIKVKISFLLMLDNNCRVAIKTESARLSENHFEAEHQKL